MQHWHTYGSGAPGVQPAGGRPGRLCNLRSGVLQSQRRNSSSSSDCGGGRDNSTNSGPNTPELFWPARFGQHTDGIAAMLCRHAVPPCCAPQRCSCWRPWQPTVTGTVHLCHLTVHLVGSCKPLNASTYTTPSVSVHMPHTSWHASARGQADCPTSPCSAVSVAHELDQKGGWDCNSCTVPCAGPLLRTQATRSSHRSPMPPCRHRLVCSTHQSADLSAGPQPMAPLHRVRGQCRIRVLDGCGVHTSLQVPAAWLVACAREAGHQVGCNTTAHLACTEWNHSMTIYLHTTAPSAIPLPSHNTSAGPYAWAQHTALSTLVIPTTPDSQHRELSTSKQPAASVLLPMSARYMDRIEANLGAPEQPPGTPHERQPPNTRVYSPQLAASSVLRAALAATPPTAT